MWRQIDKHTYQWNETDLRIQGIYNLGPQKWCWSIYRPGKNTISTGEYSDPLTLGFDPYMADTALAEYKKHCMGVLSDLVESLRVNTEHLEALNFTFKNFFECARTEKLIKDTKDLLHG